jgi:TATA-binding protein-associated factor Taf7
MANRWVEFVKEYAKENNISYTCAMCEIKTKGLYKPLTKHETKEETKTIKIKQKKTKQKKEEDEYEEEEEENPDIISNELQQLLLSSGQQKIVKALLNLNFKGRLQTNPILRTYQILQNFNTVEKMKKLIKELKALN